MVRFACIGGIGFALDAGILTLLVTGLGWGVYLARAVSFCTAVTGTWYANRRWVFDCMRCARGEYSRYFAVQTAGAGLNLCVYVALIQCFPSLAAAPVVPLAAGAGLALIFNYLGAARLVFGRSAV